MSTSAWYVCDTCGECVGHERIPEGDEWTCDACGSHTAWEFPPENGRAAVEHSEHIKRGAVSGIFRMTRDLHRAIARGDAP